MYDYYSAPRYRAYKATSTTESKVSHEQIVTINSFVDIDFCHEGMYEYERFHRMSNFLSLVISATT